MTKIAIIGAPGTGKTILARTLANELRLTGYNADTVSEYVQSYLSRYIRPYKTKTDLLDQVMIFKGQREKERDLEHKEIVICDSATFLIYVYTRFRNFESESKRNEMVIKEMWKDMRRNLPDYAKILYLPPEIPYERNCYQWDTVPPEDRKAIDRKILSFLELENVPFYEIKGADRGERLSQSLKIISEVLPQKKT